MQGYRNDLLSAGGEEGARIKVEKWLNPENGSMSWLVSDRRSLSLLVTRCWINPG